MDFPVFPDAAQVTPRSETEFNVNKHVVNQWNLKHGPITSETSIHSSNLTDSMTSDSTQPFPSFHDIDDCFDISSKHQSSHSTDTTRISSGENADPSSSITVPGQKQRHPKPKLKKLGSYLSLNNVSAKRPIQNSLKSSLDIGTIDPIGQPPRLRRPVDEDDIDCLVASVTQLLQDPLRISSPELNPALFRIFETYWQLRARSKEASTLQAKQTNHARPELAKKIPKAQTGDQHILILEVERLRHILALRQAPATESNLDLAQRIEHDDIGLENAGKVTQILQRFRGLSCASSLSTQSCESRFQSNQRQARKLTSVQASFGSQRDSYFAEHRFHRVDLDNFPRPPSGIVVLGETASASPSEPSTPSITITESGGVKNKVRFLTPRRSQTFGDLREASSNGDLRRVATFEGIMSKISLQAEAINKQNPDHQPIPQLQAADTDETVVRSVTEWVAERHNIDPLSILPDVTGFLLSKRQASPSNSKPRSESYPPSQPNREMRRPNILERRKMKAISKKLSVKSLKETATQKHTGENAESGQPTGKRNYTFSLFPHVEPESSPPLPGALHIVPRMHLPTASTPSPGSPTLGRFPRFRKARDDRKRTSIIEEGLRIVSSSCERSSGLPKSPSNDSSVLTAIHDPPHSPTGGPHGHRSTPSLVWKHKNDKKRREEDERD